MRNLRIALAMAVATPLALTACSEPEVEAPAEPVDTRTPEEQVQAILDSGLYQRMCNGRKHGAEGDVERERGEFQASAGMSEYDAYHAKRAFDAETDRLVAEAGRDAYDGCFAEKIEDAGLTETYEAMQAAEAAPEEPAVG